jgi:DNA modification methylase
VTPYYTDDHVALYHGDCREVTDWLGADVLVTDPPYGLAYRQNRAHSDLSLKQRREQAAQLRQAGTQRMKGDSDVSLRDEMLSMWGDKPGLVFGMWRYPRPANTVQRLLWVKAHPEMGMSSMPWVTKDEEIYVIGDSLTQFMGRTEPGFYLTREQRSGATGQVARVGHPTPKPVALMERLIAKCPSGVVADPFAGSGSALLAARANGRQAIGVEIEERYCEIAANRLCQDTLDLTS